MTETIDMEWEKSFSDISQYKMGLRTSAKKASYFYLLFLLLIFVNTVSCVKNGKPNVQDLIKVQTPSFPGQKVISGRTTASFSTASTSYILTGQCDPSSYLVEYSINGGQTWTTIPDGCVNSQFTINLSLVTGYVEVLVRAKGKFTYTGTTVAKIRVLRPPTSNALYLAGSSKSDTSDLIGLGSQNIMPQAISGETLNGTNVDYKNYLPALAYE